MIKNVLSILILISCLSCGNKSNKTTERSFNKEYNSAMITLEMDDESSLMILLHEDGTINRKGNGTEEIDNQFFMGMQKDSLLAQLNASITYDFHSMLNTINNYPNRRGKTCMLKISLSSKKGSTGVMYTYGSESYGPPPAITDFVDKAIQLTDPWYNEQIKMVEANDEK